MTTKRFTILYGLDEDPFDWDILDNEKDAIICQYNGTPICELLNELHEETQSSKEFIEQLQEELVLFKEAGANMGIDLNTQITALKLENEQLKKALDNCQFRTLDLLDYIKEKDVVTHQEIKDWWNNEVMK